MLTLASLSYANYDGKYFSLTPRVLRLGTACLGAMPLPAIMQSLLDKFSKDIGQSTSVSILDDWEIVYVACGATAGHVDQPDARQPLARFLCITKAGRFKVANARLNFKMAAYAIVGVSLAITQGLLPDSVKDEAVIRLLCMTGIGEAEASELAHRTRPQLPPESWAT